MAMVCRGAGAVLVVWGALVLAWCAAVIATDDNWNTEIEPIHLALVALVGLSTGVLGAAGLRRGTVKPIGLGLMLAVASFFGVIFVIGGTG
jgi:hypothetical protein